MTTVVHYNRVAVKREPIEVQFNSLTDNLLLFFIKMHNHTLTGVMETTDI